jgi:sulfoxide reductase catalytic subunit YedY
MALNAEYDLSDIFFSQKVAARQVLPPREHQQMTEVTLWAFTRPGDRAKSTSGRLRPDRNIERIQRLPVCEDSGYKRAVGKDFRPNAGPMFRAAEKIERSLGMLIRKTPEIRPSEITDEAVYLNRRKFLAMAGVTGAGLVSAHPLLARLADDAGATGQRLENVQPSPLSTDQAPNSWEDVTTYNNFYEFGTGKSDPYENAQNFRTRPWQVEVAGACNKPGSYDFEDIIRPHTLEERIYRLRCVEAWSMVVPWVGIPLGEMLQRFEPTSKAKYVRFRTLFDPAQMPGQRRAILDWPYVEGLTIEEAMHPLSLMAVGVYGRVMPNQNGAPMRLVVPWKYGFKSIKSINYIEFTDRQPRTSWALSAPREYGFYANVNPTVDHPRWSQARERVIGAGLFAPKQDTLMFNGYADQVAHLYQGMDLRKNY